MVEGRDLPVPAQGDIYTQDGELKISNAAANVFVVYGHQTQDVVHSPSSLSVGFVMGNVYLINSIYFAPFKWGRTRHFGNLIKGLGLESEGCRRGDTSIETVYDDVVCIVGSQHGAFCSIGTVAGNLVTISDLTQVTNHPMPRNVAVSYVHGLKLYESHLAYGGGLHRAYFAWASMVFPTAWQPTSPANAAACNGIEGERAPSNTENSTVWKTLAVLGQQNVVYHAEQLRNVITDQEEAWRQVMDAKRQAAAVAREVNMRTSGLLSVEKDFGSAGHLDSLHSRVDPPPNCGNCLRIGHEVRDCIGPTDANGFIAACPLCNKKDHLYDQCVRRLALQKAGKRAMDFEYLVLWRQNKAPVKSNICWIVAWVKYECPRMALPHTKGFALKLSRHKTAVAPYPDWRTYHYPTSSAEVRSENHRLSRDPGTIYEDGRRCDLNPGSQSLAPAQGFDRVRKKMEQLGVQVCPETRNSNRKQLKGQKRKKAKVKTDITDGSRFATGANCTIVQRPLPTTSAVRNTPLASVKQEDDTFS